MKRIALMKAIALIFAVVWTVLGIFVDYTNAQSTLHWKKIGVMDYSCQQVFFWNENNGLASCNDGTFPHIYYYYGLQNVWIEASFTPVMNSLPYACVLGNIFMSDSLNGLVTLHFYNQSNATVVLEDSLDSLYGLWQTHDGGHTWKPTMGYSPQLLYALETDSDKVYSDGLGAAFQNIDIGFVWLDTTNSLENVPGFYFTTDGGNSWVPFDTSSRNYPGTGEQPWICYDKVHGKFFDFTTGIAIDSSGTQVMETVDSALGLPNLSPTTTFTNFMNETLCQSGVLYLQVMASGPRTVTGSGFWRTTDGGATFDSVGGPISNGGLFSVPPSCNGGVVVGIDRESGIWETIDGGDGKLPLISAPSFAWSSIDTTPVCSTDTEILSLTGLGCHRMKFATATIENDSTGSFKIEAPHFPFYIDDGETDTLSILFNPLDGLGNHHATIDLTFFDTLSGAMIDTIIPISGVTSASATLLEASPASLAFEMEQCSYLDTIVTIYNHTCDNIILKKDSIVASGYTLTQDVLPQTLTPGSSFIIKLHFTPIDTSSGNGTLVIYTSSVSIPDTLSVTLQAVIEPPSPRLTPLQPSFNFGALTTCNGLVDTFITFTNTGCAPDTITSLTLTGSGFTGPNDTLPIIVAPGDSVTLEYHFVPSDTGVFTGQVNLNVVSMGLTENLVVGLSGTGVPAAASLSLSDTGINFGTFSQCGNPVADSSITITNTGCDSLALSGASVDAGSGFTLVSSNDTMLAPNESASFTIHFADSMAGSWNSNFHIIGTGANGGNTIDTTVSLTATITPGSRSAAINLTAINFGTTSICEERDSSVTITNTGCEPDTIFSGELSSLQFALDTSVQFPIVLMPDSSVTFPIFTHLDTTGHPDTINATLNFTLDSGVAVPSVMLTRSVTYPGEFSLSLAAEASAPINTMVSVYILRHGTIPNQATEVDFDLVYNDDLLSYNAPLQPDIVPNGAATVLNGITDRPFKMSPATDRDTIATLQFLTYLTKNDSTAIQLVHQRFDASGIVSPSCVAAMDTTSTPSNFNLILTCGDSTIIASWNDTPPFSIESIQPNPASDAITIRVDAAAPGSIGVSDAAGGGSIHNINCEMYDALGREQDVRSASLRSGVSLDVTGVPSGIYFMRVSAGGYVESRSVVVSH
jgi:hypothetical protein